VDTMILMGITEVHSGVELELNAKPLPRLSVNAMLSIGSFGYMKKC
jgi:hypothetical protein